MHFAQLWMSPKRLLALQDVSASRAANTVAASNAVQLRSQRGQFQVASGKELIEAAYREATPLLPAQLVAI